MKENSDPLRIFRNNIFHLREDTKFAYHFFNPEVERLSWACELHLLLAKFFSQYRVCCEVHYVFNGRKGESDLTKKKAIRRKKTPLNIDGSYQ